MIKEDEPVIEESFEDKLSETDEELQENFEENDIIEEDSDMYQGRS